MGRAKKVKYSYYTSDPIPPGALNSVYIGISKDAQYSTDGITFEQGTTFTNGYAIDYSPTLNRWVATDVAGGKYSDDGGITWTGWTYNPGVQSYTPNTIIWIRNKSKFFLGGDSANVPYFADSPDGINWTTRAAASTMTQPRTMAYSPTLDMIIAAGDGVSFLNIQSSTDDMLTWNTCTYSTPRSMDTPYVVWADFLGLFIISNGANTLPGSPNGYYITSPDGINWTTRQHPYTTRPGIGLAVGLNEILYKTTKTDGNGCWRSTDAINWVQVFPPNKSSQPNTSPWFNNQNNLYYDFGFVAPGSFYNNNTYTSTDGITWIDIGVKDPWVRDTYGEGPAFSKRY